MGIKERGHKARLTGKWGVDLKGNGKKVNMFKIKYEIFKELITF